MDIIRLNKTIKEGNMLFRKEPDDEEKKRIQAEKDQQIEEKAKELPPIHPAFRLPTKAEIEKFHRDMQEQMSQLMTGNDDEVWKKVAEQECVKNQLLTKLEGKLPNRDVAISTEDISNLHILLNSPTLDIDTFLKSI